MSGELAEEKGKKQMRAELQARRFGRFWTWRKGQAGECWTIAAGSLKNLGRGHSLRVCGQPVLSTLTASSAWCDRIPPLSTAKAGRLEPDTPAPSATRWLEFLVTLPSDEKWIFLCSPWIWWRCLGADVKAEEDLFHTSVRTPGRSDSQKRSTL